MTSTRLIRKGRINRHERVTQVLRSGAVVSPDEIRMVFKGTDMERLMYRIPINIYNIRQDGGIIRVTKKGRTVTGYQLMNPEYFDANGRYCGAPVTPKQPQVKVEVKPQVEEVA